MKWDGPEYLMAFIAMLLGMWLQFWGTIFVIGWTYHAIQYVVTAVTAALN